MTMTLATASRRLALSEILGVNSALRRGLVGGVIAILLWEVCSRAPQLFGFFVPYIGVLPPPSAIMLEWTKLIVDPSYWISWYLSFARVFSGFFVAFAIGVPLGLLLARNRNFYGAAFPVFEVFRPIPPIAWIPVAIIFWPMQELSIAFVIFLGAFYTITLNTMNGAREIDPALIQSALSMGASNWSIYRWIILPATLPSIVTGAAIGMGITWEVVVAAEMISSGGASKAGGGLGHLMWNAYISGHREAIVVAMISIGIAGYGSSALLRLLGGHLTPWLRKK